MDLMSLFEAPKPQPQTPREKVEQKLGTVIEMAQKVAVKEMADGDPQEVVKDTIQELSMATMALLDMYDSLKQDDPEVSNVEVVEAMCSDDNIVWAGGTIMRGNAAVRINGLLIDAWQVRERGGVITAYPPQRSFLSKDRNTKEYVKDDKGNNKLAYLDIFMTKDLQTGGLIQAACTKLVQRYEGKPVSEEVRAQAEAARLRAQQNRR